MGEARARGARVATGLVAAAGLALAVAATAANRAWFERHVALPYYFHGAPRGLWLALRLGAVALGMVALGRAARLGARLAARVGGLDRGLLLATVAALGAAVVCAELVLRLVGARLPGPAWSGYELKVGRLDPRYGWTSVPARTTALTAEGRSYAYAVNRLGLRAARDTDEPDLGRPALIVAGESIASGYGLGYEDGFAARCGRSLDLEVLDVAEGGYGFDQAYLRASDLLPRIRRPVAVVTVFVPSQLGRSLRDDRPRLALDEQGGLRLLAPASDLLARTVLGGLLRNRLPYAGETALERSLALARAVFQAGAREAIARGAAPLYVVPSAGPPRPLDAHPEGWIVRALFADTGLPYLVVDLGPDEVMRRDGHPNAAGARRIAAAVADALRPRLR